MPLVEGGANKRTPPDNHYVTGFHFLSQLGPPVEQPPPRIIVRPLQPNHWPESSRSQRCLGHLAVLARLTHRRGPLVGDRGTAGLSSSSSCCSSALAAVFLLASRPDYSAHLAIFGLIRVVPMGDGLSIVLNRPLLCYQSIARWSPVSNTFYMSLLSLSITDSFSFSIIKYNSHL